MNRRDHIINKQVLEIHLPENENLNARYEELSRLYREKLVPLIAELCDRHSAAGTHCRIEQLTIDLGEVRLEEMEAVFAEKFAEAIAPQQVTVLTDSAMETEAGSAAAQTPLDALSYYLMSGTLPWWAPSSTKDYLHQVLDALNETPGPVFKALMRQVGREKVYLDRFLHTFSEAQVRQTFSVLSSRPADHLSGIRQAITDAVLRNPRHYPKGLDPRKITHAFWAAVFTHLSHTTDPGDLTRYVVHQTLRSLGVDPARLLNDIREKQPASEIVRRMEDPQTRAGAMDLAAIHRLAEEIRGQHRDNPLLQAFCRQLSGMLGHPLFFRVDPGQVKVLHGLLKELAARQMQVGIRDAMTLKAVTGTHLAPISRHLQFLDTRLRQLEPSPAPKVMERLRSRYDETDFIAVQNAGLVILWPFLQRFFENLGLLDGKAFDGEAARHKAACVLQYLADEEEEGLFEGQLSLNKVLCGIGLPEPVAPEPLTETDKAIAEGLLQAVISRGPLWKNLSLAGLRSSYLRREGLLRSRDGHWLLQVKKETHDITLEKLPWGFGTVKLPWMNEILIVEWN